MYGDGYNPPGGCSNCGQEWCAQFCTDNSSNGTCWNCASNCGYDCRFDPCAGGCGSGLNLILKSACFI